MRVQQYPVVRLYPDNYDQNSQPQKVYWLSRHAPTKDQQIAWLLIHSNGSNLVEVHHINRFFHSTQDLLTLIRGEYADGFCYLVCKTEYVIEAIDQGGQFGSFEMFKTDRCSDTERIIKFVWHYNSNSDIKIKVLSYSKLENYQKRQVVSVA